MIILHWSLLLILVFLVPYIIGTIMVTYMDKSFQTPAMNYLCGWFLCFAIFEIVSVPFILLQTKFILVVFTYSFCVCACMIYAFIKRKKTIGNIFTRFKFGCFKFDKVTYIVWLVFILIVLGQIATMFIWTTYDGDDPYFIVIANMANLDGNMYVRDAYTGFMSTLDMRHALSPMPLLYAWFAKVSGTHVSTVAHLFLGPAFLILMYVSYGVMSKKLFKKMEKARPWFMILLSIWYMFGNISLMTSETFMMNRTWQGKAVLGNIVLPVIAWCLMMLGSNKVSKGIWMLLTTASFAGVFCSSVSFMLIPTMICVGAVILGVQRRSIKYFVKICMCALPCILYAVVYLIFR